MPTNIRTKTRQLIPELDWLRGVSAIMVMLYHYTTRYEEVIGHIGKFPLSIPWGVSAVVSFFAISGFLAADGVFQQTSIRKYCLKKLIRLYPVYWVCLFITKLTMLLIPPEFASDAKTEAINFSMLQSFAGV